MRNLKNFWIELLIDGRKTKISTGPRSKSGGFSMTIFMRDRGKSVKGLVITGRASTGGSLVELHTTQWGPDSSLLSFTKVNPR